jgi:hypothetical protein
VVLTARPVLVLLTWVQLFLFFKKSSLSLAVRCNTRLWSQASSEHRLGPRLRPPPFRLAHLQFMVHAAAAARANLENVEDMKDLPVLQPSDMPVT